MKLSVLSYALGSDAVIPTDLQHVYPEWDNTMITGLCLDSRKVVPGDLFIAYPGFQVDGRQYIEYAIAQGASAVFYESGFSFKQPPSIPVIAVQNLQDHLGHLASTFYQHPSKQMRTIAITGTNGKTTCTQLIAHTLHAIGTPCGVIGTLGYGLPPEPLQRTSHTTSDAITLQQQLSTLKEKTNQVAMEVSSHALQQKRTQGIEFNIGIFTNLSQDHLDYHKTMEQYWQAKKILFTQYALQQAIINLDDPYGLALAHQLTQSKMTVIGYSLQEQGLYDPSWLILKGQNILLSSSGIQAHIVSPWGEGLLKSSLLGRFNLSNLLAALAAICVLTPRLEFETILGHLSKAKTVPGRMQTLGGGNQPLVVIDYAHTPDALKQVLMALREHTVGQLWCVFGCGGNRDAGKRPLMGRIAERYSDQFIITDDNPRDENPNDIVQHILEGLACPEAALVEHDRKMAIAQAIERAKSGDIVLVAGKGHEHEQVSLNKKAPFNDFEEAALALKDKG